jgi:hypothetical protein
MLDRPAQNRIASLSQFDALTKNLSAVDFASPAPEAYAS